jgi:hypothetical protein
MAHFMHIHLYSLRFVARFFYQSFLIFPSFIFYVFFFGLKSQKQQLILKYFDADVKAKPIFLSVFLF